MVFETSRVSANPRSKYEDQKGAISLITSWTVATRGAFVAHVCRVVKLLRLQGWLPIRISTTPSKMGDGLIAVSKRSN
jgi:hypothetical protein